MHSKQMAKEKFKYTLSVSYPRCGYGLTNNIIMEYFMKSEVENYRLCLALACRENKYRKDVTAATSFSRAVPCKIEGVVLQKTHDRYKGKMFVEKDPNRNHLFLYRNPMSSIASHYVLRKTRFKTFMPWEQFADREVKNWNEHMVKWHLHHPPKGLRILYECFPLIL